MGRYQDEGGRCRIDFGPLPVEPDGGAGGGDDPGPFLPTLLPKDQAIALHDVTYSENGALFGQDVIFAASTFAPASAESAPTGGSNAVWIIPAIGLTGSTVSTSDTIADGGGETEDITLFGSARLGLGYDAETAAASIPSLGLAAIAYAIASDDGDDDGESDSAGDPALSSGASAAGSASAIDVIPVLMAAGSAPSVAKTSASIEPTLVYSGGPSLSSAPRSLTGETVQGTRWDDRIELGSTPVQVNGGKGDDTIEGGEHLAAGGDRMVFLDGQDGADTYDLDFGLDPGTASALPGCLIFDFNGPGVSTQSASPDSLHLRSMKPATLEISDQGNGFFLFNDGEDEILLGFHRPGMTAALTEAEMKSVTYVGAGLTRLDILDLIVASSAPSDDLLI